MRRSSSIPSRPSPHVARGPRVVTLASLVVITVVLGACRDNRITPLPPAAYPLESSVGLDLTFVDGTHEPLAVLAGRRFHIDSLIVLATAVGPADPALASVQTTSMLQDLDWSGLEFDQERRMNTFPATVRVERYYHHAAWMTGVHEFTVTVRDATGSPLGNPVELRCGPEWPPHADEAFATRRFGVVLRTDSVPEDGVLDGVSFVATAAMQLRNGIRGLRTFLIPQAATTLEVRWGHLLKSPLVVPLAPVATAPWDHGLRVETEVVPPAGGKPAFDPGDAVTVVVHLSDRQGVPLHPGSALPSYQDYLDGVVDSGIQYAAERPSSVYYLDTNQERTFMASFTGPVGQIRQTHRELPRADFLSAPVQSIATVPADGYCCLTATVPPASVYYLADGSAQQAVEWTSPLSSRFTFELPDSALAGTYLFTVKVHRDYRGEHSIVTAVTEIEVGDWAQSKQPDPVSPLTGNCEHCHQGDLDLSQMLHHTGDTDTCTGCHTPFEHRLDNLLPYRIHRVHYLSDRFVEDQRDCTVCHVQATEEVEDLAKWLVCTGCHKPHETHDGFHPDGETQTCADVFCHHAVNPQPHLLGGK